MDTTGFRLRKAEAMRSFSLLDTFVHLKGLGQAGTVASSPDFWGEVEGRPELLEGRLVASVALEKDEVDWEMHPSGDELLVALGGAFDLVLQDGRTDRVIELPAGQAALVPFGTWHRLRVRVPGEVLFVRAAKGTLHRTL